MIGSLGGALPPRPGAEVEICASPVLSGIKAISVPNEHLFVSGSGGDAGAMRERGPSAGLPCARPVLFPAAGVVGSRAAAFRTPWRRRCAAGLRPVLDLFACLRGMAAGAGKGRWSGGGRRVGGRPGGGLPESAGGRG